MPLPYFHLFCSPCASFVLFCQDLAADCVRIDRLLYFGRDFLCGLDPPVLKLQFMAPSLSEYVSVVEQQSTGPSAQRSLDSDAQVSSSFHRWIGQFAVQKHMSIRRTVSMSFAQISIPLEPQSSPLSPPASICSLLRLWSPKNRSKWMESTKKKLQE